MTCPVSNPVGQTGLGYVLSAGRGGGETGYDDVERWDILVFRNTKWRPGRKDPGVTVPCEAGAVLQTTKVW